MAHHGDDSKAFETMRRAMLERIGDAHQGELRVLDETGDTKIIWSKDNEDEVEAAKETFGRLKKKGYMAYSVKKNGDKNEVIHEFDPDAEKLIMAPRLRGG